MPVFNHVQDTLCVIKNTCEYSPLSFNFGLEKKNDDHFLSSVCFDLCTQHCGKLMIDIMYNLFSIHTYMDHLKNRKNNRLMNHVDQ